MPFSLTKLSTFLIVLLFSVLGSNAQLLSLKQLEAILSRSPDNFKQNIPEGFGFAGAPEDQSYYLFGSVERNTEKQKAVEFLYVYTNKTMLLYRMLSALHYQNLKKQMLKSGYTKIDQITDQEGILLHAYKFENLYILISSQDEPKGGYYEIKVGKR